MTFLRIFDREGTIPNRHLDQPASPERCRLESSPVIARTKRVDGIAEPHDLRTRRIGNHYAIELHILMDGNVTLHEAHDKASEVERLLKQHYGPETHIAVHVEPKQSIWRTP